MAAARLPQGLRARWLAPTHLIAVRSEIYYEDWFLVERATGSKVMPIEGDVTAVASARGVFYVVSRDPAFPPFSQRSVPMDSWSPLAAYDVSGKDLWRIEPDEEPRSLGLGPIAALGGRVLVVAESIVEGQSQASLVCSSAMSRWAWVSRSSRSRRGLVRTNS